MKNRLSALGIALMFLVATPVHANTVTDWWDSLWGDDIQNITQDLESTQTNIQGDTTIGDTTIGDTKVTQGSLSVTTSDEITIQNFKEITAQMANSTEVTAKAIQSLAWQVSQNTKDTNVILQALVDKNPVLQIENASSSPFKIEHTNTLEVKLATSTLESLNSSLSELQTALEDLDLSVTNTVDIGNLNTTELTNLLNNMGYSGAGIGGGSTTSTTLSRIQVGASGTLQDSALTHYGFDQVDLVEGTDLALSGTGSVTGLQAGKTYKITAVVQQFFGGTSNVKQIFRIVDLTASSTIGRTFENFREFGMATQVAFFTPTVTTEVGLDYESGNVGEISPKSTFIVEEVPSTTAVDVAALTPTTLSYGKITLADQGSIASGALLLDTSAVDIGGVVDTGANGITVTKAGTYEIGAHVSILPVGSGFTASLILKSEGVEISRGSANSKNSGNGAVDITISEIFTLAAGDTLTLETAYSGNAAVNNIQLSVSEQPDSSTVVVDPTTVTVEDVETVIFAKTSLPDGTTTTLDGGVTWQTVKDTYESIKVYMNFVSSDAKYFATARTADLATTGNNISASIGTSSTGNIESIDLADGSFLYNASFTGNMEVTIVGVKAQKTVVNTTDLATNDQTASGYFDFGTMRMQWGTWDSTIDGAETQTFPAAFGAAPTYVNAQFDNEGANNGNNNISVDMSSATTTSIDINRDDANYGGTIKVTFFAIGLKP